ncbi:MAG: PAS domain-containing sensor histidine kinase, partial [Deltaproteobacteria bacterium]|nr:PAS domain-containing sensor histidine kinase [Deltaproteobacteria bacterium]
MGIRTKILSAFFIMTIMLVLAGVWTIYEVRSVGSTVEQFLDENYRSITAAKSMIESLEREDSATLLLLLGRWDEGREILEKADALFLDAAA